jgi:hypothetical protein
MNKDQTDAFGNGKSVDEMQIEKSIEILQCAGFTITKGPEESRQAAIEFGWKVTAPPIINDRVKNLKDLRNYFYMRLWTKYPSRQLYHVDGNWQKEIRMVRLFVESREKTGLNRYSAIQECVALIDIIFDHEEEFNFKSPININVLGQDRAGWITQKASLILNSKRQKQEEKLLDERLNSIERETEDRIDPNKATNKLNELLSKMEANNG